MFSKKATLRKSVKSPQGIRSQPFTAATCISMRDITVKAPSDLTSRPGLWLSVVQHSYSLWQKKTENVSELEREIEINHHYCHEKGIKEKTIFNSYIALLDQTAMI